MRVLVVEDEEKIASFIRRGLKEEGFAVDVARDGDEGHFLATTNDYDLLTMDVMLPKLDGFSLCKQLRNEGVNSSIIMLSVKDDIKDKVKGLDCGADDYLTKPFEFRELLARVRAQLRKKHDGHHTPYVVGDLTLDPMSHDARRGERLIPLTSREYALLEYLMRHAGRVVTRTMLAEHVWDINFDSNSNVIDVYINYLRSKIDDGHSIKLIRTVRGRGYLMTSEP